MKQKMGNVNFLYPIPVVLVGARVKGRPNYSTIADCGIASVTPSCIFISMNKKNYTTRGVIESGLFSVNIPSIDLAAKTDYCGMVSGNKVDKSKIFTTFFGVSGVPMAQDCPINLECKVIKKMEIFDNILFIGEIIESYINNDCLINGRPDALRIKPLMYDADNYYRTFSDWKEYPFKIGKTLMKE